MKEEHLKQTTPRRGFIGTLAAGAAALGFATLASPFRLDAQDKNHKPAAVHPSNPADEWFNKIHGKHRIVFDATRPHEIMPFAWPRVFLMTNGQTGSAENECGVVVVLRHEAIGYALEDRLWAKYKLGAMFNANDPSTKAPSERNPFWQPKPGDFKIPGFGPVPIGINELQASGVLFCVCNAAITVFSAVAAENMKSDAAEVKKDWLAGLLPGIQVVPSGVWAVGRAQEHGCQYCFAG